MNAWKLKRDDGEWTMENDIELRAWARDGRIRPQDYLFNPTLAKWMYARDVEEVSVGWAASAANERNECSPARMLMLLVIVFLLMIIFSPDARYVLLAR